MASLDFSSQDIAPEDSSHIDSLVDTTAMGKRDQNGFYEVADYSDKRGIAGEDDDDSILSSLAAAQLSTSNGKSADSSKSAFSSFFSRLGTSAGFTSKTIAASDVQPVLNAMREHLMNKNVARDIADKVCDSVGQSLVGKKTSGFGDGGVKAEFKRALEASLTRVLTSKTSTDILLDITRKRQAAASGGSAINPYTITFVGVNGVGKSTNLSKVAFWLLQNRLRVLIAACDTFRSGAVEQLRVHVKNLGKLKVMTDDGYGDDTKAEGRIELFEKGYGKDAAGIAKDAIAHGT
jgi:signal recognition particle receptor subunit alpha